MLSFDSIPASTVRSRSDPRPCSSHVASFFLVYILVRRARSWRGVMRFDRKSNSTIIDVKSFLAKNRILFNPGRYADYKSGTFSQLLRCPVNAMVDNSSRSWTSACIITQSSLQRSHLPRVRAVMYTYVPLVLC
jgi:hypothetical protein